MKKLTNLRKKLRKIFGRTENFRADGRTENFRTDGRKIFGRTDGRKIFGPTDGKFFGRTDGRKIFGRTDGKFSDGRTEKFSDGKFSDGRKNFGRPFTPRTCLRSARNFGKTRFRWFAMFHFSTLIFFVKVFFSKIFGVDFCFQECKVLEELWIFNPRRQMRRKNSLPELPLFLRRVPWRRGKRPKMCRHLWLGTKNDLTLWCDHNMIIW